jgi:DNA/RNA endonuclease YhcR with UshA esterase domain
MKLIALAGTMFGLMVLSAQPDDAKPLTPVEAIDKINETVLVLMEVKATKNRLEKRGEIYLDSKEDFRDDDNLGVVITKSGAARFKEAGIDDPAQHFKGKTIRVRGKVVIKEDRPRIEIDDPKQIELADRR